MFLEDIHSIDTLKLFQFMDQVMHSLDETVRAIGQLCDS
jgi:hypothetical protein